MEDNPSIYTQCVLLYLGEYFNWVPHHGDFGLLQRDELYQVAPSDDFRSIIFTCSLRVTRECAALGGCRSIVWAAA
jgi:hypothetical protein